MVIIILKNFNIVCSMLALGIGMVFVLTSFLHLYYNWYVDFNLKNTEYAYTTLIDSKGAEYKAYIQSLANNKGYSGKTITFYDVNSESNVTLESDDFLVTGHIGKDGKVYESHD